MKEKRRKKEGERPASVLPVTVHTGARLEAVGPLKGGRLKISVFAPADKGKANQAVLALLSRWLGLPKGRFELVRGRAHRRKEIRIEGLSSGELAERLQSV